MYSLQFLKPFGTQFKPKDDHWVPKNGKKLRRHSSYFWFPNIHYALSVLKSLKVLYFNFKSCLKAHYFDIAYKHKDLFA